MNLTLREHLQLYLDVGYRIFDCYTEDKSPTKRDMFDNPVYTNSVTYGIVLGIDDLVLDYDPKRDPTKRQLQDYWDTLQLPSPQPTFTVKTGSGGAHIYYRKPVDFKCRGGTIPGFPSIDIRSAGNYVIGAGSLHKSGNYYEIVRGTPGTIIEAPEAVLQSVKRLNEVEYGVGESDDSEWNQQRFKQWIQGGGHADGLYVVCARGKDYGLSASSIEQIVYTHCNPLWSVPATLEDIRRRVNNSFQFGQNEPGCKNTSPTVFASVAAEPKPSSPILDNFAPLWDQRIIKERDAETGEIRFKSGGVKPTTPSILAQCCTPDYRDTRAPNLTVTNPLFDLFRFNEFSQDIEFKKSAPWHPKDAKVAAWRTVDASLMSVWLSQHSSIINPEERQIERAILALAHNEQYHPVRDYLNSLTWDGKPRLDTWLIGICGSPDTSYVREIGKNTIIAACARVFEPGCQHDAALVLEGEQDAGKTSVVRILGGPWYADVRIDPKNKDTFINMLGKLFLELSEMAFIKEVDVERTKSFMTITTDSLRLPYERRGIMLPRQGVFVGSVNPKKTGYLRDITGNRRFWVVETSGAIKLDKLREERDQLFAEAYTRYRMKEKWHIVDPSIRELAKAEQQKRMVREVWMDDIEEYLSNPNVTIPAELTTAWIAYNILGVSPSSKTYQTQSRINYAMQMLGYENEPKWMDGKTIRYWKKAQRYSGLGGF